MHSYCVLDVLFTYQRIRFSWLEHTLPEGRFHFVPVYDSWQNVSHNQNLTSQCTCGAGGGKKGDTHPLTGLN